MIASIALTKIPPLKMLRKVVVISEVIYNSNMKQNEAK